MQNLNPNPNPNIQMISSEPRQPNLVVVTRGGDVTGANQKYTTRKSTGATCSTKESLVRCPEGEGNILGCETKFC